MAELTIIVQNSENVRALTEDGAEARGLVQLDRLQRSIIGIFEDWLSRGLISRRYELEALGSLLYTALFNEDIEPFFEQARADVPEGEKLRVQLSFEDEALDLAHLPWEYLYYPKAGRFFATHIGMTLSRYVPLVTGRPETLQPREKQLRILIVVSEPEDLVPVVAEPMIEAIQKLSERYPIDVEILDQSTIENFVDKLRTVRPHILHFIGHGRFNRAERNGEIALLDLNKKGIWYPDRVFAEYFSMVRPVPRLVFLHAPEGAVVGADPNRALFEFRANSAGLAPRLMGTNIQAVVAMQHPITNRAAIAFGRAFYKELLEGKPVDDAVQEGRMSLAISDPRGYDNPVFGTPVLYMNSIEGLVQPLADNPQPIAYPMAYSKRNQT